MPNNEVLYLKPHKHSTKEVQLWLRVDFFDPEMVGWANFDELDHTIKSYVSGIEWINKLATKMNLEVNAETAKHKIILKDAPPNSYLLFHFHDTQWKSSVVIKGVKATTVCYAAPRITGTNIKFTLCDENIGGHICNLKVNDSRYTWITNDNGKFKYLVCEAPKSGASVVLIDLDHLPYVEKKIKAHINN